MTNSTITILLAAITVLITIPPCLTAIRDLRKKNKALQNANSELNTEINNIKVLNPDLKIYENVDEVLIKIRDLINEQLESKRSVKLKNYGLDLETIQHIIDVIENRKYKNVFVDYKGLIIDPKDQLISKLIDVSSNIKTKAVELAIDKIKDVKGHNINDKFDLRLYQLPPIIHGFNINDEYLFLGFTEINNSNKLIGGAKPYLFLKNNLQSEVTNHYFSMFNSWFNWQWKNGREI